MTKALKSWRQKNIVKPRLVAKLLKYNGSTSTKQWSKGKLDDGMTLLQVVKYLRDHIKTTDLARVEDYVARIAMAFRAYRAVGKVTTRLRERGEDYERAQRRERQNKRALVYELDRLNRHWFFEMARRHSVRWRMVRARVRARAIAVYWHSLTAHIYVPGVLDMEAELASALAAS